jgi:hypothetical protein
MARQRQIGRVLDTVDADWPSKLRGHLEDLRVLATTELQVEFALSAFNIKAPPA